MLRCLLCFALAAALTAQDYKIYSDHPRLLLRPQRLRLLRRERDRNSPRWQQFAALISGRARLPEPGFAQALYYQVSGDAEAGNRALQYALSPSAPLRDTALVFDWCQALLSPSQSSALAAKIRSQLAASRTDPRALALAAVALAGHVPTVPEETLRWVVETWWRSHPALPRDGDYGLFELMHTLRDNLEIDLQEDARDFFKRLPLEHLLGYYPAIYPAPENDYQIPCFKSGDPDLARAAAYRAAELAMVAYNSNTVEYQYVQGWLMRDRFALKSPYGAPYEFLWANPYQPGLSYRTLPLFFHDPESGRTYARSDWNESARWAGYFDGITQLFENGEIKAAPTRVQVGATILAAGPARLPLDLPEGGRLFVTGLRPNTPYDVEVDDEEMSEASTGPGGVLAVEFPPGTRAGFRMHERGAARP